MIYPIKVFDANGKLKKIVSREEAIENSKLLKLPPVLPTSIFDLFKVDNPLISKRGLFKPITFGD